MPLTANKSSVRCSEYLEQPKLACMAKSGAIRSLEPVARRRWQKRLGAVFLVAGLTLFSVIAFNEFVEPYFATQRQNEVAASIREEFAQLDRDSGVAVAKAELEVGESFAVLYAPRLGSDYRRPIAQGTSVEKVLNTVGIGHYLHSAMPHELGNFALAAHRTTHGGAFNNIDRFVVGDSIFVETRWGWYRYEVVESAVVEPNDFWVVGSNPLTKNAENAESSDSDEADATGEPARLLTLTTCTPRYTSEKRLVVWAKLVDERPRELGAPAEIRELTIR